MKIAQAAPQGRACFISLFQHQNMVYGYAPVSAEGQNYGAQKAQLEAAGYERVFAETASGARSDRKQLARVLHQLTPGDVLMVTRLDRLAQ